MTLVVAPRQESCRPESSFAANLLRVLLLHNLNVSLQQDSAQ